jgi:chemotaxis protein methyltransferase CheR
VDGAQTGIFRAEVRGRLGLQFGDDQLGFLEAILARRAAETRALPAPYLERLVREGPACPEWDVLAEALTVTETFFFRNVDQFRALAAAASAVRSVGQGPRLRLLSAACA